MYKVYCDDNVLLSLDVEEYMLTEPVLDRELNKTGTFSFCIYPEHPRYDDIHKLKSIIKVYDKNTLVFRGRVLNITTGFNNEKQVTCEGELAFLVDSIQRPYDFMSGDRHTTVSELFAFFINNHNEQVEPAHRFIVGNVTVTDDNNYIVRSDSTYLNTWDSINKKLIESYGGYLNVRHDTDGIYIDYLSDMDRLSNQKIELGKNLLDLSQIAKGEDIATAVIPLGAKLTDENGNQTDLRLTIESINDGKDYVYNQEAVDIYGWIFKTVVYDEVTDKYNLKTKGNAALGEAVNTLNSIELSAVDMALIDSDINSFHLGTYVRVISKPHNIDSNFLVSKISINLLDPGQNTLTLGKSYKTFTEIKQKDIKEILTTGITYQTSSSGTQVPQGEWTTNIPETSASKPYLWTRSVTIYTDNSTATSYSVSSTINGVTIGGTNLLNDSELLQSFEFFEPVRDVDTNKIYDFENDVITKGAYNNG